MFDRQLQWAAHRVDIAHKLGDSGQLLRLVQRLGALLGQLIVVQRLVVGEDAPGMLGRAQQSSSSLRCQSWPTTA